MAQAARNRIARMCRVLGAVKGKMGIGGIVGAKFGTVLAGLPNQLDKSANGFIERWRITDAIVISLQIGGKVCWQDINVEDIVENVSLYSKRRDA